MSTPLTTAIQNLTASANATTGASDTTLTDAVATLIAGYGGGSSYGWTKIAETTYTTSTTSTSAIYPGTFETGDTSIFTSAKIVYVRIRDTAGKRAGYFYGSDSFYINPNPVNGSSDSTYLTGKIYTSYTADSKFNSLATNGTGGYGVYTSYLYSNGDILIAARYHSTYSLTINGTYKVEVYTLDWPDGVSVYA